MLKELIFIMVMNYIIGVLKWHTFVQKYFVVITIRYRIEMVSEQEL